MNYVCILFHISSQCLERNKKRRNHNRTAIQKIYFHIKGQCLECNKKRRNDQIKTTRSNQMLS